MKYLIGHLRDYVYSVGDVISDSKRNLTIIDRRISYKNVNRGEKEVTHYFKEYKYHCNKCGYERWTPEVKIKTGNQGCGVCAKNGGMHVVTGINDIPTTAPWMIPYFQGGYDEAKQYTRASRTKVYFKCPSCNKIKTKPICIYQLYYCHSIGCDCSDCKSYPNKFAYAFLRQLPINNLKTEWQPKWLSPYAYDAYFEYNHKQYVLEMDGEIGHGNFTWRRLGKDVDGKLRDEYKDKLANQHGVTVIRIDAKKSTKDYLRDNLLCNTVLKKMFNLDEIDWDDCDVYAQKNLIKEVCEYWENAGHPFLSQVADALPVSVSRIREYLKTGSSYGWCSYNTKELVFKSCQNPTQQRQQYWLNNSYPILCIENGFVFRSSRICASYGQPIFSIDINKQVLCNASKTKHGTYKGFHFKRISMDEYNQILKDNPHLVFDKLYENKSQTEVDYAHNNCNG